MKFIYKNIKYILINYMIILNLLSFQKAYSQININIPSETKNYLQNNGIDSEKLQFLIKNFIKNEYEIKNTTLTPSMIKNSIYKSYYYIVNKTPYNNLFKTNYFNDNKIQNKPQNDFWNGYTNIEEINNLSENSIYENLYTDDCLTTLTGEKTDVFSKYKPTLQPIVLIDNKLINVFAQTVGVLKKTNDNQNYFLFINGKNTNLIWSKNPKCPKPQYWTFLNPWVDSNKVSETTAYFCYTCKLIEFSFQIITIMSNIIFKEWAWSILALMVLLAGLYILQEYYNNIEILTNEGDVKKLFIKLGKRMLIAVAAIAFLFNINGTIIAYVYRPIIWATIAISDSFLSEEKQNSKCGYLIQKEIFDKTKNDKGIKKFMPGLAYINTDLTKQSDTSIDLSNDVICSFFRIEKQLRMYIALSTLSMEYNGYGLIKSIISIIITISFIFMNLLWTLYYVEVVLMIGLATFAIPFALLGWAVPWPYFKDWRLKILKIFKNGSVKLVMMSMLTMIIGSFISYVIFGINTKELEQLMLSDKYNKIILMNISEFSGFNIIQILIGLVIISYILSKMKSWEQDLNSLIGGSSAPTNSLASELSNILKQVKNKAIKGVAEKTKRIINKWKK